MKHPFQRSKEGNAWWYGCILIAQLINVCTDGLIVAAYHLLEIFVIHP